MSSQQRGELSLIYDLIGSFVVEFIILSGGFVIQFMILLGGFVIEFMILLGGFVIKFTILLGNFVVEFTILPGGGFVVEFTILLLCDQVYDLTGWLCGRSMKKWFQIRHGKITFDFF